MTGGHQGDALALIGVAIPFASARCARPIFFGSESSSRCSSSRGDVASSVGFRIGFRFDGTPHPRALTVTGRGGDRRCARPDRARRVSAIASGARSAPGMVTELTLKSFGLPALAFVIASLRVRVSGIFTVFCSGVGMKLAVALTWRSVSATSPRGSV